MISDAALPMHMGTLHGWEAVLVAVVAFGPFVVLAVVLIVVGEVGPPRAAQHNPSRIWGRLNPRNRRPSTNPTENENMTSLKPRTNLAAIAAVAAAALFALAGCAGNTDDSQSAAVSDSPTASVSSTSSATAPSTPERSATEDVPGVVIDVHIDGNQIAPNGDRVEVKVGEPVTFFIRANRPGGLHVHSDPEQSFDFDAGKATFKVVVDKPGIVDVEEHEADKVIVQLEVRP